MRETRIHCNNTDNILKYKLDTNTHTYTHGLTNAILNYESVSFAMQKKAHNEGSRGQGSDVCLLPYRLTHRGCHAPH